MHSNPFWMNHSPLGNLLRPLGTMLIYIPNTNLTVPNKRKMELEARKHDRQCQPTNKSTAFNSADQHHSRSIHFSKGFESPKTLDQDSESFSTTLSTTFDEIAPSADLLPSYSMNGEKFNTTSNSKPKGVPTVTTVSR